MHKLLLLILFYTASTLFALDIDEHSSNLELLQESKMFIDTTSAMSKEEVLQKEFKPVTKSILNFGIIPESRVWFELTLHNSSDKEITKILEYANIKPEEVLLYDGEKVFKDGLLLHHRTSLRPTFKLTLKPDETKSYLISAHSQITALIARLTLWNVEDFYNYELAEKLFIMAFFTIFVTLLVYNFVIFIFTKDEIYLYYTIYLIAVILFELIYLGIAQIYLLPQLATIIVTKATLLSVVLLVAPMILFTMKLLQTWRFKKLHFGLNLYLYLFPVVAALGYDNFLFDLDVLAILLPLAFLMLLSGYYAYKEGTKEALLYLFGWSFLLLTLVFAILQSLGIFNIFDYFRRTTEVAFSLEVFIFSIAVAYRIKRLNNEKERLNIALCKMQKDEKQRLEKKIALRTKELKLSVEEKELLYQELQHRVKNNLAFIMSILELQIIESNSDTLRSELQTTLNRIHSFTLMYQLLLYDKESRLLKTKHYFEKIIKYIKTQFDLQVTILLKIEVELPSEKLLYYGLVLNELVTNSFKHAFDKEGEIKIDLYEEEKQLYFRIKDNGRGYIKSDKTTLGMTIVQTLVTKQLRAKMRIRNNIGTEVLIFIPKGK